MFDVLATVQRLLKIDRITIDNVIFCLHYKVTMVILVISSLLVTKKQYFGDPIVCMSHMTSTKIINMFCWIQSTFTVPALTGAVVGQEVAHPGVPHHAGQAEGGDPYQVRHHKYYQWVALFLFLQAGMFYVPRYIWKNWEGGRVRSLVDELNLPILKADLKQRRVTLAVDYFGSNFHHHNLYAYQFFVCEMLNFCNVVGQFFFLDRFLDYGFSTYGPRVVEHAQEDSDNGYDPKDEIFPKVAKCTFHKFGTSGTIERHDILCVLPLNILNEKIFLFLWFWFLVVAAASAFGMFYRLATFAPGFRHLLLRGCSRLASGDKVEAISRKCRIGDWFLLYLLAANMDPFVYKDFINDLTSALVEKEHKS